MPPDLGEFMSKQAWHEYDGRCCLVIACRMFVGQPVDVSNTIESSAIAVNSLKTFASLAGVLATPIFHVIMLEDRDW